MTGFEIDPESLNYYDLLGVARDVDPDDLRAAYLSQAKRWHPDVQVNASAGERRSAAARFRAVREAWGCLSDERRKADYDRSLPSTRSAGPRGDRPPPGPSPAERKPSTWLARSALSAVVSRLGSVDLGDDAITQASSAVFRTVRPYCADDEPAPTVVEAQRRAYTATVHAQAGWTHDSQGFRGAPVLSELIGESLWVMTHELWAELDPRHRTGLVEPPTRDDRRRPTRPCSVCGRTPTAEFRFRAIRGRVVLYQAKPIAGVFCRDCAQSIGRDAQHVTINAGWWGVVAIFRALVGTLTNGLALRRAAHLGEPVGEPAHRRSPLDPGGTVLSRGVTGLVLLAGLLLMLVVASQMLH